MDEQSSKASSLWPPNWPMGLTMLRLLLLPFFLYAVVAGPDHLQSPWRWTALAIFAVMALTDKLDGFLARKFNQVSKLGAILDPVADKLLVTCSVFLLSVERIAPQGFAIPWWVVACVYGKDVVVVLGVLLLFSLIGPLQISARWSGKVSTFLQLILVLVTLMAPDIARFSPQTIAALAPLLWWVVSLVTAWATVDYVMEGVRRLRRASARGAGAAAG
ncbi:MAG: CDP-alcohol phosphatidyltransferase family protein [Phycisphaerae bacterium]|nr:CDP-alcohol phosphatidyltransferase family protein [Phycisphaerae bacterium]MDW8262697.1 CDP-alcohol phosphatidyltransferase family protein [Phycisphaerales bacterium]